METLFKTAAVCAVAAVLAAAVRRENPAMAVLLGVAAGCAALLPALGLLREAAAFWDELADTSGIPAASLGVVLKTLGISILTRFASDLCKETGAVSAASAVEFTGSCAALAVALPLMRTAFRMLEELLTFQ